MYVCLYDGVRGAYAGAHVWRAEDSFAEWVLSFHLCVNSGIKLRLSGLHSEHL